MIYCIKFEKSAIDSLKLRSGLSLPTFTELVEITIESANVIMSFLISLSFFFDELVDRIN